MKKIISVLLFIIIFIPFGGDIKVFAKDIITSHIPPVFIYSEVEKYLRNKWSAPAVPAIGTRDILDYDSYAIWFTPELGKAWLKNKTQQNIWGRWKRWKAKSKLKEGLMGKLQFQFYLKGNPKELRLNADKLYGLQVYLGDDIGNVYEPTSIEKGPYDYLVHKDMYQFTVYFSDRNPVTYEKIVDKETKFVKIALKIRDSKYFFKWDLK